MSGHHYRKHDAIPPIRLNCDIRPVLLTTSRNERYNGEGVRNDHKSDQTGRDFPDYTSDDVQAQKWAGEGRPLDTRRGLERGMQSEWAILRVHSSS